MWHPVLEQRGQFQPRSPLLNQRDAEGGRQQGQAARDGRPGDARPRPPHEARPAAKSTASASRPTADGRQPDSRLSSSFMSSGVEGLRVHRPSSLSLNSVSPAW